MPDNFSEEEIRGYASIGHSYHQEWSNYKLTEELINLQKEVTNLQKIVMTLSEKVYQLEYKKQADKK